jgi:hypothetical protein
VKSFWRFWVVQIMAHSARTFSTPPQQELAESARLFDLSEHRFHHLLSQSIGRFEAAVVDFLSHLLGQRSADFSVCCCRVLGASGSDIAVNTVCFERFEVGFAAVAAETCSGLRPRLFSMASIRGTNWR